MRWVLRSRYQRLSEAHAYKKDCPCTANMALTHTLCPQVVLDRVESILAVRDSLRVRVNILGFSRGGVAAILICKSLSQIPDARRVAVNLAIVDPVPGELGLYKRMRTSSRANSSSDLSGCLNLQRVLALYCEDPFRKRVVRSMFRPVVPKFPPNCYAQIDVIPQEHSTWQGIKEPSHAIQGSPNTHDGVAALCAFYQLKCFLTEVNTVFTELDFHFNLAQLPSELDCLHRMDRYLQESNAKGVGQSRPTHNSALQIVRHNQAVFLNKHHEALNLQLRPDGMPNEVFVAVVGARDLHFCEITYPTKEVVLHRSFGKSGHWAHISDGKLQVQQAAAAKGAPETVDLQRGDILYQVYSKGQLAWPRTSSSMIRRQASVEETLQELFKQDESNELLLIFRRTNVGDGMHDYLLCMRSRDGSGGSSTSSYSSADEYNDEDFDDDFFGFADLGASEPWSSQL